LRQELVKLRLAGIDLMHKGLGNDFPEVKALRNKMAFLQEEIKRLEAGDAMASLKQELARLKREEDELLGKGFGLEYPAVKAVQMKIKRLADEIKALENAPVQGDTKKAAAPKKLLLILEERIDVGKFAGPLKLKDALQLLQEQLAGRGMEVD